ncbi:MAG: ATP synthase subunit C [Bulleidia sp.]
MLSISDLLLPLIAVALIVGPLALVCSGKMKKYSPKSRLMAQICLFAGSFLVMMIVGVGRIAVFAEGTEAAAVVDSSRGLGFLAAAIAVGCSCIAAGWAVAKSAPAALGAISENSDNFGRAIIFVALGEGCAIYGLLIAILILNAL